MSQGLYSRLCALNALVAVFDGAKPLDQSLDKNAAKYNLSAMDKSFAHALCGFVLRYKPELQSIVNKQANRKRDIDPSHLNVLLLMGAAQIYLMDGVADHAAVDTCVELTARIKCNNQRGFVNAILRNLIRNGKPDSLCPSLPSWLVQSWEADYGAEISQKIMQASLDQALTGITNKDGEWRLHTEGDLTLCDNEWVQDYSSAMPVSLLDDLTGKNILDLCAAPGGKTMQLASMGANVTSIDISEKRLRRLKENLDRTNLQSNVEIICADILKWTPQKQYDVVLLDAPCSATGTIRRHPDLPYIRCKKDLGNLVKLQSQLLNHVKNWGNEIVYCTCSLQKDEGEHQINNFLVSNPDLKRARDDIRLLPCDDDGNRDGFFISHLIKQTD